MTKSLAEMKVLNVYSDIESKLLSFGPTLIGGDPKSDYNHIGHDRSASLDGPLRLLKPTDDALEVGFAPKLCKLLSSVVRWVFER